MRKDEHRIFEAMMAAVQGQDIGAASNAGTNVLASLIVAISPSLEEAELGADHAAQQLKTMVRLHWKELHGASPATTPTSQGKN